MQGQAKRGDVFMADLEPIVGSEQGGVRPVLVVQNDLGNQHGETVIVAAMTTRQKRMQLPTHVVPDKAKNLEKNTTVLTEQIRTIDKARLKHYMATLNAADMQRVDAALIISLGLNDIIHMPFRMFLCTECALRMNFSREYAILRVEGDTRSERCMCCAKQDGFYFELSKLLAREG